MSTSSSTSSDDLSIDIRRRIKEHGCWCGSEILMVPQRSRDYPTRQYFRCSTAIYDCHPMVCDDHVFLWLDETYGPETLSEHENDDKAGGGGKGCWCGHPIVLKTSKSRANPNRRFFRCKMDCHHECVFIWVDEAYRTVAEVNPEEDFWDDSYAELQLRPDSDEENNGREEEVVEEADGREEEVVEEAYGTEQESVDEAYGTEEDSVEEED